MMKLLPPELLILVLKTAALSGPKNDSLHLRLVCREFDAILKPLLCETTSLDISKLSKLSLIKHPDPSALQTIGRHCKSLFVDLMVLRDPSKPLRLLFSLDPRLTSLAVEVHFLRKHLDASPPTALPLKRYCMGPASFTETDFRRRMDDILFNCGNIERARLSLPLPFVGQDEFTTTFILANALAALACRPEEDSAILKALVLESMTASALRSLLNNPLDRWNISRVFEGLDHLVLSVKSNVAYIHNAFAVGLWVFIGMATSLKTLCLIGLECGGEPPDSALRLSRSGAAADGIPATDWTNIIIPSPNAPQRHLTCLELRRIDLDPDFFIEAGESFGSTLRELYLNKVCMRLSSDHEDNDPSSLDLWVGLPNVRPAAHNRWIAQFVRRRFPELRVCRATHLSYDYFGTADDWERLQGLDIDDPCGLGRDIARRFVEAVMGYEQPELQSGGPCEMLPYDICEALPYAAFHPIPTQKPLRPAPKNMQPSSWDVATYHELVANPTSNWLDSIDSHFPNSRTTGAKVLRDIAEAVCRNMNTLNAHRFHPQPPESGFRVVYDDDIPLGLLIGHLGPQRLQQLARSSDPLDLQWVAANGMPNAVPGPDESDSGEEGDDEPGQWDHGSGSEDSDSEFGERELEGWDGPVMAWELEDEPYDVPLESLPGFVILPDGATDFVSHNYDTYGDDPDLYHESRGAYDDAAANYGGLTDSGDDGGGTIDLYESGII